MIVLGEKYFAHPAMEERTRLIRVQVRTRPIRDGLDAVLRGLPTVYFERLKCEMKSNGKVLIGKFQNDLIDYCLDIL